MRSFSKSIAGIPGVRTMILLFGFIFLMSACTEDEVLESGPTYNRKIREAVIAGEEAPEESLVSIP